MDPSYLCPVCGFQLEFDPRGRTLQNEKMCPCCGIHFGYDDESGNPDEIYAKWRQRWIDTGKLWWSKEQPPPNYNPDEQLAQLERRTEK